MTTSPSFWTSLPPLRAALLLLGLFHRCVLAAKGNHSWGRSIPEKVVLPYKGGLMRIVEIAAFTGGFLVARVIASEGSRQTLHSPCCLAASVPLDREATNRLRSHWSNRPAKPPLHRGLCLWAIKSRVSQSRLILHSPFRSLGACYSGTDMVLLLHEQGRQAAH